MLRATFRNLFARKLRLLLSAFAIVLGVSFVTGSFIFTDTLEKAFTGLTSGAVGDVIVRVDTGSRGSGGDGTVRTVPASLVATLEKVPGAARADGRISSFGTFVVGRDGKLIGGMGAPGIAVNQSDGPAANGAESARLVSGRWPTAAGEVVLDPSTAERGEYAVGDTLALITTGERGRVEAKVVGVASVGGSGLIGASLAIVETRWAQELFVRGSDAFNAVWVTRAEGVSQDQLKANIDKVLPKGFRTQTGDSAAAEAATRIQTIVGFINDFLLVFAGIALVVGAFIIVNTFAILIAQRSRELALLRAIGASRRQVTRSVLVEALVIALVGSGAGVGLGVLLALGIKALFGRFGLDLSQADLIFRPRTVIASFAVGLIVTLVAAYLPARRAGRIPPVAAMRDDVALAESGLRWRLVVGVALIVLGAVMLGVGLFTSVDNATYWIGAGALAALIGTALTSPVVGRPVISGLGAAFRRAFGVVGLMAEQNARRNPRRTAATASALMIGVALVTMMSVLGASSKATVDQAIARDVIADFVVSNAAANVPFSSSVAPRIARVPGVASVSRTRSASFVINRDRNGVQGIEAATFPAVARTQLRAGSLGTLTANDIAVSTEKADASSLAVGTPIKVTYAGQSRTLTVTATYVKDAVLAQDFVVDLSAMDALGVPPSDRAVYVVVRPDADRAQVQKAAAAVVADLPTVTVSNQQQLADAQHEQIDRLLFIVYALLGLAVVIAVLGIVNTLALSVMERTREIGLLRAVGLSRAQLRTMIRLESVSIAVLGAVLGVGLGIAFGVAIQRSLATQGMEILAIPGWQLLIFVLVAAVVGVLAAVVPGRRAARMGVLQAIASE